MGERGEGKGGEVRGREGREGEGRGGEGRGGRGGNRKRGRGWEYKSCWAGVEALRQEGIPFTVQFSSECKFCEGDNFHEFLQIPIRPQRLSSGKLFSSKPSLLPGVQTARPMGISL